MLDWLLGEGMLFGNKLTIGVIASLVCISVVVYGCQSGKCFNGICF